MYMYDPLLQRDRLSITRERLLTRVSDPASEPVSLAEAKLYARVDTTSDDTLITDLITATRVMAESWLRRSLITQSWKLAFDDGVNVRQFLPMGPVSAITSVVQFNQDGTSQTLDSSLYGLNAAKNQIVLASQIGAFRVEITYVTGYGAASAVPKAIKQGLLSHIAYLYDNRGEGLPNLLPEQVQGLYQPFRVVRI